MRRPDCVWVYTVVDSSPRLIHCIAQHPCGGCDAMLQQYSVKCLLMHEVCVDTSGIMRCSPNATLPCISAAGSLPDARRLGPPSSLSLCSTWRTAATAVDSDSAACHCSSHWQPVSCITRRLQLYWIPGRPYNFADHDGSILEVDWLHHCCVNTDCISYVRTQPVQTHVEVHRLPAPLYF